MELEKGISKFLVILSALLWPSYSVHAALDANHLSAQDIKRVESVLNRLAPLISQRREHQNLATLTFDELYAPLDQNSSAFLKKFQTLDGRKLGIKLPYSGIAAGNLELITIKGQQVRINGQHDTLPPQFLPQQIYQAYNLMMEGMHRDIGKRLYVQSGYRSSAYQLYLFVSYLKNHRYSITETAKFVALPGYSEHGDPQHQAIDFINENGVDQNSPKEFENLPEYKWLLANAGKFGFVLSYPQNAKEGITFEPWHWRFEKTP